MTNTPSKNMPPLPYEQRGDRRINVVFAVAVEAAGRPQIGRITELSRSGARLLLPTLLATGEEVVLRRGGLDLIGKVTWQRHDSVGIGFIKPLDETAFLRLRRSYV
jgi:hypothetical protein